MNELTPERIRDAAEVLEAFASGASYMAVAADALRDRADKLEREQAAEVKREKRIEEIAREVELAGWNADGPGPGITALRIARALIARYPALAEGDAEPVGHRLNAANCKQAKGKGYPISSGNVCYADECIAERRAES